MGSAANIRNSRVRAGKSQAEVGERLQVNPAWYQDLETRDDELATTLTLFQVIDLADFLGVSPGILVGAGATDEAHIPVMGLPARIQAHLAAHGLALQEFEEELGWELDDFLRAPLKAAAELPLEFFQALAPRLGFDWLALVPQAVED